MTPKQAKLLAFIRTEIESTGVCPSYQEMADAMGMASRGAVFNRIDPLVRAGHLVRTGGVRGLALPVSAKATEKAAQDLCDLLYAHHVIKYDPEAALRCAIRALTTFRAQGRPQ